MKSKQRNISLEYLAGFFDEEGCIRYTGGQWEITCSQTEKNSIEGLQEMQKRWPGSFTRIKSRKPNHSSAWRWKTRGVAAAIALCDMFSFLNVKQAKAALALKHLSRRQTINLVLSRLNEPKNIFSE